MLNSEKVIPKRFYVVIVLGDVALQYNSAAFLGYTPIHNAYLDILKSPQKHINATIVQQNITIVWTKCISTDTVTVSGSSNKTVCSELFVWSCSAEALQLNIVFSFLF